MNDRYIAESPRAVAELLFNIGAVNVNLANYYKLDTGDYSPMYIDAKRLGSFPKVFVEVKSRMESWVSQQFKETHAFVGVSAGGIVWSRTIANCRILPHLIGLREPKQHGLGNQIEGILPKFDVEGRKIEGKPKVIVIDDVITTGRSALSVVEALRRGEGENPPAEVLAVFSIFDWDFAATNKKFEEAGVKKMSILSLSALVEYGMKNKRLCEDDIRHIEEFRRKFS